MQFIFKAGFLIQGRTLHANSIKKDLIAYLGSGYRRQICEPIAQPRFYNTENQNLSSEKRERLYDGVLQKKIRLVKMFSLMTSAGSILCQPYLIWKVVDTGNYIATGGVIAIGGLFAFVTPVLLHMVTKRYVIHIDYNPTKNTYIATTYSLFVRKKEIEFTPEDVELPNVSEMLMACRVKGKPMFFDVDFFTDIDHYRRIMGFDKPMDLNVDTKEMEPKKNG